MPLQVRVLDIYGTLQTLALNRAGEGCRNIEIQCVSKLIDFCRPAGLDPGYQVPRVMSPEAGFAQRPQQIAKGLETEEIQTLVGDLEFCLLLRLPDLPTHARLPRRIVRLINGDVVLPLHALDQFLD